MKKVPITHFIWLWMPVLLLVPAAWADVPADLKQADDFYQAGQYAQAEQGYRKVIQETDPNRPAEAQAAFQARKSLPLVYLATDRLPQAKEAVQQLLSRHAQYESLPHAIHEIVEGAKPLYKLADVRQLYQDMVTARPDDRQTLWLKMGTAIASVHLADYQATDAMLQTIVSQHGADDQAAEALNHIAWACRKLQKYDKALTIYQYAVDHWPRKDRVAFSQEGIVICHLGLGNPQAADKALEVLLQMFGQDKNVSKLVLWAAQDYFSAGQIAGAARVFDLLVQNYPDAPEAVEAQAGRALALVQLEDRDQIESVVQTLLARFAPSEAKALGLHNLANTLVWKQVSYVTQRPKPPDAFALYNQCLQAIANYTLQTWPQSDWAMWAERDSASVAIFTANDADAQAATARLLADYADRKELPEILYFLGNRSLDAGRDDPAQALYQHLVGKYPGHELVPLAKSGLVQILIRRGDDKGAEDLVQKILTDHANHPKLAEAINLIAERYFDQGMALEQAEAKRVGSAEYAKMVQKQGRSEVIRNHYQRAIQKWRIIIEQLPPSPPYTANAWYFTGVAYRRHLDDPGKAIPYYQKVVETWPDYKYAWSAQSMLALCYETLVRSGKMTTQEAEPKIEQVYKAVIEKYSNRPLASRAYVALGEINLKNQRWDQAIGYLQQFLEQYPQSKQWSQVLILLGIGYERGGKPEIARELYRSYLQSANPDDPRVKLVQAKLDEGKEVRK